MKGWHCKTELQQEHRRKAENHQNKLPTLIHTHTHSSACQTPDIYIRRGRTQWACGGIEGWGGEVGHAIGGCKHCKTVSPWKPAHCSEASHSPSIQSTAPQVFPKPSTLTNGPPNRPLASPASLAVQHSRCAQRSGLGWLDPLGFTEGEGEERWGQWPWQRAYATKVLCLWRSHIYCNSTGSYRWKCGRPC